jgi:hypothetical protein
MGHGAKAFLAGSLGFAVAFVVACGSGNGLLSSDEASTLNAELGSVSSAVSAHDCAQATSAAQRFNTLVGDLPRNVSTTLIKNLGAGAVTVAALAQRDCHATSTHTTTSTTSTSTTTTTVTNPTTPTTQTNPTSTTTSTSTSATNPTGTGTNTNGGAGLTTGVGANG